MPPKIIHYFDYKSPYAYLAQEATLALQDELGMPIEWLPYTLDVPSYLGKAELDASGRDTVGTRTEHQWRRVRYTYMDCRREASRRGLVLRGPRKIFDSSIAHVAFLYVKARGNFRPFHDAVYERFWKRELDLEDRAALDRLLDEFGFDPRHFAGYLADEGHQAHDRIRREAEAKGVFGVPSYLVDDELFWGSERIERVREAARASASLTG
jgi:2-hydroxychromene-2-carboxylate isomerase